MGVSVKAVNPRTRLALGLVAGIAAIGILSGILYLFSLTIASRDQALSTASRSYKIMLLARELEVTVERSDVLLGRFVVLGSNTAGNLYGDEMDQASFLLTELASAARERPDQTAPMARLEALFAQWQAEANAIADLTMHGARADAYNRHFETGLGSARSKGEVKERNLRHRPRSRAIALALDDIVTNERTTLASESQIAAQRTVQSNRYAMTLALFGLVLILAGVWLAWSAWRAARQFEDEERRAELLEAKVDERNQELIQANQRLTNEMLEREAAEAQLRQVQKMDAIGQMTGGIAHDFNNMLAVVIGGLELAKRRVGKLMPDVTRYLDQAMEGATRATSLTKQLLAFARGEPLLPRLIDVNQLVTSISSLLERTLGESIAIALRLEPGLWPVYVDPNQLENAILNLAVNARDAMPQGGTLTIETRNISLPERMVEGLSAGDYTMLTVADTGIGMNAETLERVFEPFFTTKAIGKGSGLGLSQAFGFVRQSEGVITVHSTPNEGAAIAIYLPRRVGFPEPMSPFTPPSGGAAMASRQTGLLVLVVEDDPRVLVATTDALTELGHVALACSDPAAVAGILHDHADIDLILCDVMMPGTSGPELIAALRPRYPHIPVLFVTGYAGASDAGRFGDLQVLRKPFTINALESAIAKAQAATAPTKG